MYIRYLKLGITCLSLLLTTTQILAQDNANATAKQVVEKFQADLISVMKNGKQLGYSGRYTNLQDSVNNSHDLPKIARVIVGKEWEKLTEAQQQKLEEIIIRLSISSYAHNFKDYAGESFEYDSEEETTRGGVLVHSHLNIPNDKPVKFDYMLKETGTSWRIINIIANGVSDLALKRSEYTSILQNEGFDALVSKIDDKINNYSKL
ncbi:MAG: ABC transporter substrate-binding protein [Methylococcales bacterium]|nr:ABC transporter substrate-binding protein [Methylococcales bacterium]